MINREKVIGSLEVRIISDTDAGYSTIEIPVNEAERILALLKEQEPIAPSVCGSKEPDEHGVCCWRYLCGKCKKPIDHKDRFCKRCGKAVKWDE